MKVQRNPKLTVIIDGHYLFYKTLFSYERGEEKLLCEGELSQHKFCLAFGQQLVNTLNRIPAPHKLLFVVDYGSWRKHLDIPDEGYKGNRIQDKQKKDIYWNGFHEACQSVQDILNELNIPILKVHEAEGDDVIRSWVDYSNKNEYSNTIIITGDSDITQCIGYNDNCYTIIYNPMNKKSKLFITEGFIEWLNNSTVESVDMEDDPFNFNFESMLGIDPFACVQKLIENGCIVEEVNPLYVSFTKALCGDDGDNIPSTWQWEGKKRMMRLTKSYVDKMISDMESSGQLLSILHMRENEEYQKNIVSLLESKTKQNIDFPIFQENLVRNINATWLSSKVIPIDIQLNIDEIISKNINYFTSKISLNRFKDNIPFKGKEEFKYQYNKSDIFKQFGLK